MNTPNKLTLLRIALVPFFVAFLLMPSVPHHYLIAGLIFGAAALTDHFDGKLARKNGQITDFGKFADPLADKILVVSAFLCFVELDVIGAIPVIIVLFREFLVTSIRLVASGNGKVIAANGWGKAKTISQIAAILVIIVLQYGNELILMQVIPLGSAEAEMFVRASLLAGQIAVWICVGFTLISGGIYLWDNRQYIKTAK
ncbi:MAG: CDP-diacylglycerol--glycerol-3-phosphate 3-phosphatidyltransferase [Clostridiales bacterium]|jgi:CDP-diacylglycerol--glycerol-3-phosphate 3-phosphatidyltransferase|nr:CDP-diacylglycerol--glycerol-3-phosphate 3-phosphatidyltransferase [Clostridiales bacterium]